jgi:hypothetical protein
VVHRSIDANEYAAGEEVYKASQAKP